MTTVAPTTVDRRLEQLIIESQLENGDQLPPEKILAQMLKVSRPALREGLRTLEERGILVSIRGRGRFVQTPDISGPVTDGWSILLQMQPSQLLDLLQIRHALEVWFLPQAMGMLLDEDLAVLDGLVQQMEKHAAADESFASEDRRFHQVIFSRLQAPLLQQLLTAFWDLFFRSGDHSLVQSSSLREGARLHRELMAAIAQRDLTRARYYLESQFYDVQSRLTEHFGAKGVMDPGEMASPEQA